MKKVLLALAATFCALSFSSCCKPDKVGDVTIVLHAQETGNWCWLANTQMVHQFFGGIITQCDLANSRLGKNDCCTAEEDDGCPKNDDCNTAGNTKGAIESLGYTLVNNTTPLSWDALRKELDCGRRPMVFGDGPAGDGVGHVRVIYGFAEVGGVRYLYLKDPAPACDGDDYEITYEQYSNTAGPGRVHRKTFTKIKKS